MGGEANTAKTYRQRAADLRAAADRMKEPENARAARSVADDFDQLAKDLESAEASALKDPEPPN